MSSLEESVMFFVVYTMSFVGCTRLKESAVFYVDHTALRYITLDRSRLSSIM